MPNTQIGDNQKAPFQIVEFDSKNFPTAPAPGDTVTVVPADPTVATVVFDDTPAPGTLASGFVVGGKPGANLDIVATVTHADGTSFPPVTDTVDIVPGTAKSIAFNIGTPVDQ